MAEDVSPLLTFNPEKAGIPALPEAFLLHSMMLSSTDNVVVLIIVLVPDNVKFPLILTSVANVHNDCVCVLTVVPSTTVAIDPVPESVTVMLVLPVPILANDKAAI